MGASQGGLEASGSACANFVLKNLLKARVIGISGGSENYLRARYIEKNGETI
jgi:hypothetical protein